MRHLGDVHRADLTGYIFAEGDTELALLGALLVFGRLDDFPQVDRVAVLVRDFDTDSRLARNGCDPDTGRCKVQRNVIGEAGDFRQLDAGGGSQFIPRDRGAAGDVDERRPDAEALEDIDEFFRVVSELCFRTATEAELRRVQAVERRQLIFLLGLVGIAGSLFHFVHLGAGRFDVEFLFDDGLGDGLAVADEGDDTAASLGHAVDLGNLYFIAGVFHDAAKDAAGEQGTLPADANDHNIFSHNSISNPAALHPCVCAGCRFHYMQH